MLQANRNPLDRATLAEIRAEVAGRAEAWHAAFRSNPLAGPDRWDPRLVRAEELEGVLRWLDRRLADCAPCAEERWAITPAGLAALNEAEAAA